MIKDRRNQNMSHKAFTLIEMMIVLIIMGIMLMFTVSLSGSQIRKVKNKAVKESILAEMQTRYSRNLGSSSFAGKIYSTMEVKLKNETNNINFTYNVKDGDIENSFYDHFEIKYLGINYEAGKEPIKYTDVTLKYLPYKISCQIGESDENKNLVIITSVNDNKDYCFEIKQKNCRLTEMSEENCNKLKNDARIDNN